MQPEKVSVDTYEQENVVISCNGMAKNNSCNAEWKNCTWSHDEVNCQYIWHEDSKHVQDICDVSRHVELIHSFSGRTVCKIRFKNLQMKHNGNWSCSLDFCNTANDNTCKAGIGKPTQSVVTLQVCNKKQ